MMVIALVLTFTGFDALKSRGTVRLALQNAGLEPRTLTKEQAEVLLSRVLPQELKLRGIADATVQCTQMAMALKRLRFERTAPESAEAAFARFGRK